MKLKVLFFLLFIHFSSIGQELFSDIFAGQLPASLLTIDSQLYVGTLQFNNGQPIGIYRQNFDNSEDFETVLQLPNAGIGLFYMAHDASTNSIIGLQSGNPAEIIRVDLDLNLPIDPETIYEPASGLTLNINGGLIINDGFIYFSSSVNGISQIQRIPVSGGSSETFFIPSTANFVVTQIHNNQLYYVGNNNDTDEPDLFRVDLSNPVETFVSDINGVTGFIQSSYINENNLYLGFESSGDDPIIRFDLNGNIPLEHEVIIEDLSNAPLGITGHLDDLYYTDGGAQTILLVENVLLNVGDFQPLSFNVFPNPSNSKIFINLKIQEPFNYSITDILGKRVLQGTYSLGGVDISELNSGVYFVTVVTEDTNSRAYKLIKQ